MPAIDSRLLNDMAACRPPDAEARVQAQHRQLFRAANAGHAHDLIQTKARNREAINRLTTERAALARRLDLLPKPAPVYLGQNPWHPLDAAKACGFVLLGLALVWTSFRVQFRILDDSGAFEGAGEVVAVIALLVAIAALSELTHSLIKSPTRRTAMVQYMTLIAIACGLGASTVGVLLCGAHEVASVALGESTAGPGRN
jgi:hypothetical protein